MFQDAIYDYPLRLHNLILTEEGLRGRIEGWCLVCGLFLKQSLATINTHYLAGNIVRLIACKK